MRRADRSPPRGEALLLRFARVVTARPRTVLAAWLVLVALSTPFAMRVSDVLTQQGASKVVASTDGAVVAETLRREFPAHSEREVVVVLEGWDQGSLPMRQLLAVLDAAVREASSGSRIIATTSAYTVLRQGVLGVVEEQLGRAGLAGREPATALQLAVLAQRLTAAGVPAPMVDLVVASQGATTERRLGLVGDFVVAADWSKLPVPEAARALIAPDSRATLMTVSYDPSGPDPSPLPLRSLVGSVIASLGLDGVVSPHVTGEIPLLQDTYARAEADNTKMEYVAYLVILLVLLLFFRAVAPAVITVVVIALAMNVSQAWLYLLGTQVQLTQFTMTIMTFVMLGAGIDYSMLLSSRYRQERLAGRSVHDAVVHATARAGESVLLAGAAVVLSFGATLLSPVDWIPPLGYGGLVGIPIMLFAALTITPCLLVLLGDRFFWLGSGQLGDLESRGAMAAMLRRAMAVTRACPAAVVALFVLVTIPAVLTVGAHRLSADPIALSPVTDSQRGAEVIAGVWGRSALFPTVIAGQLAPELHRGGALTEEGARRMSQLADALRADPGVQAVSTLTEPGPVDLRAAHVSDAGAARVVVTLREDPFTAAAQETVERLGSIVDRSAVPTLRVGGATQVDVEYAQSLLRSFWLMVSVVTAGVFVLLLLALRSVLIPIRLVLTIMMSNVWAIALTLAVFVGLRGEAVINDLPVFLVILMMGLGMDYEIFLITRVREFVRSGHDDETATALAVADTGRVITAAGLVMAGSLGTMLLSSTLMLQQYGLGLGSAVLLDATLVRMFLVPASLLLLRRLNRWVPALPRLRPA